MGSNFVILYRFDGLCARVLSSQPDVVAPGLNILAAWSPMGGGMGLTYNIVSGTSMSCPHVAGVSALLRSAHRDWSPAMIRSALMTTAYTTDNVGSTLSDTYTGGTSNAWGYGAGHIDPNAALEPGLVYDISTQNYVDFICGLNYTGHALDTYTTFVAEKCTSPTPNFYRPIDLNYPSFSVFFNETSDVRPFTVTTARTLTNVGPLLSSPTIYTLVALREPTHLNVFVTPTILTFDYLNRHLSYNVTFTSNVTKTNYVSFGSLTWSDGIHKVTSPISFIISA